MGDQGEYQDIKTRQIDGILETNQKRLAEWIAKNPGSKIGQIPPELYPAFLPRRVYELASNPEKIRLLQLPAEKRVRFLAYEKDYSGEQLTDPAAWQEWQKAKEDAKLNSTSKITVMPTPPKTVNHFHATYDRQIRAGQLKLTDRVLMENHFGQESTDPEVLHVAFFDSERRQGIGKEFYQNTLPNIARQFGVRFIVGTNTDTNLSFFTDAKTGLGRNSINQIKSEYRKQFFPNFSVTDPGKDYSQYTIQFLYPEDRGKYLI